MQNAIPPTIEIVGFLARENMKCANCHQELRMTSKGELVHVKWKSKCRYPLARDKEG